MTMLALVLAALPLEPLYPGSPAVLRGHTDTIVSVAFSPDGKQLASGSRDKTVRVWNLETGDVVRTIGDAKQQPFSLTFSPDGKRLAIGDTSFEVRIVELSTGAVVSSVLHPDSLSQISFDAAGTKVLVTGLNANAAVYAVADGKKLHELRACSGSISADGKQALVATPDHTISVVDLKTGKAKKLFTATTQTSMLLSSKELVTSWAPSSADVAVWDRKTGKLQKTLAGPEPTTTAPERVAPASLFSASLSADGSVLATSSIDHVVRVWNVANATITKRFEVQQSVPLAVSADGAFVAAGDTGVVKIFKL